MLDPTKMVLFHLGALGYHVVKGWCLLQTHQTDEVPLEVVMMAVNAVLAYVWHRKG